MAHEPLALVLRQLRRLVGAPAAADASDGQLLERFVAQHEESAFATLMQRHGPLVLSVCRRLLTDANDVDDAFQATFAVLVRRAASLKREGSLGSWLYVVAQRVALKARANAARRRSRETQAEDMAQATEPSCEFDPQTAAARRELRLVLDAEVSLLPEKYRAPVVLCYLEGKTNEEAARELGYPIGSMSWRLDKGRELLRQRLVGRGLALSAGAMLASLAASTATAAVPVTLGDATLKAALLLAAGNAAAGALSAPATALADNIVHGMVVAKARFALVVVLLLGLAGGAAGLLAYRNGTTQPTVPPPDLHFADGVDQRVEDWQPKPSERRIDEIGWAPDIRTAERLAKEHNRPVFLFTHSGRIGTGRCGGSAFNLRAYALSDDRVINILNRFYIPVFAPNDDYTGTGTAPAEEKAERTRIYHETLQAKLNAGDDCMYILSPDGKVFDSLIVRRAKKENLDTFVAKLQQIAKKLGTAEGPIVVAPKPLSVPPAAPDDSLVLHLVARAFNRKVWCEFPSEDYIVLAPEQWRPLVPASANLGDTWEVAPELTTRLLRHFYPQTENNDLSKNRIDRQSLRATVVSQRDGIARIRLDGELKMKHTFYQTREDNNVVDATLLGFLDYDLNAGRIRSLRLVTDQATYGGHDMGVAVRSLP
ncbi:MAG: sigma-70 family RNA polymerase sigma factor [Gemmataceae bacterium]|nr:sigma-70 family RNA polymerase sigma factor [Gemmataceae bacterium]